MWDVSMEMSSCQRSSALSPRVDVRRLVATAMNVLLEEKTLT